MRSKYNKPVPDIVLIAHNTACFYQNAGSRLGLREIAEKGFRDSSANFRKRVCSRTHEFLSPCFSFLQGFLFANRITGQKGGATYYAMWMFQWAFAATAATIVSGAVAERCAFGAYLSYTFVLTAFIYPVVVHWGWSAEGWLSAWTGSASPEGYAPVLGANGLIDFAGSGIVHMTGGGAALMGAIFLGPRTGRFAPRTGEVQDMPGHSTVLAALGTFILWFGWYGFNPVSTLAFHYMRDAARVAVTTTMSACAGGATTLAIHVALKNPPDVSPALNGILAGLVSITAPCPVVDAWAAVLIGFMGAFVYYGSSKMLLKLKIDDPLDASPVHFFCGAWGVIAAGLFARQEFTMGVYGSSPDDYGALFGGGGKQLGIQIVAVLAIAAWVCGLSPVTARLVCRERYHGGCDQCSKKDTFRRVL